MSQSTSSTTLESILGPSSPLKRGTSSSFITPLKGKPGVSIQTPLTPGTSYEYGFSAEKAALVIEIGSRYSKVGFAGESSPRHIFPTHLNLLNSNKNLSLMANVGDQRITSQQCEETFEQLLNEIYFRYLQANTKDERKVVIVEDLISVTHAREALMTVLYNKFKVPTILCVPSQALSLTAVIDAQQHPSAIVVDCGYSETRVLPIYEGIPLTNSFHTAPLGSRAIIHRLANLLKDYAKVRDVNTNQQFPIHINNIDADSCYTVVQNEERIPIPHKLLEDILVRLCFIEPANSERTKRDSQAVTWPSNTDVKLKETKKEEESKETPPQIEPKKESSQVESKSPKSDNNNNRQYTSYPLNSQYVIDINLFVRTEASEVLFEEDIEGNTVANLILQSLLKCPQDTRIDMAASIYCIGGSSMIPGFKTRLLQELRKLTSTVEEYQSLKGLEQYFWFLKQSAAFQPNCANWVTASIIGCLDYWTAHGISKEQFSLSKKESSTSSSSESSSTTTNPIPESTSTAV